MGEKKQSTFPISENQADKALAHSKAQANSKSQFLETKTKEGKTGFSLLTIVSRRKKNAAATNYTGLSSLGSVESSKTVVMDRPIYKAQECDITSLPYLVCLMGPKEMMGHYWKLEKEMIVGRSRICDIAINDLSISKKHLLFQVEENGKVFIEDKGSTNGTFINEKRVGIHTQTPLLDNSKVRFGNIVFKFLDKGNQEIISVLENYKKAFYDSLTGVGNRLFLEKKATELFQKSKKNKCPLSVVVFDIDHFKRINDTYGHPAGDLILKSTARLAQRGFRSMDIFARSGGEEFCVVMQASVERAKDAIEQVRQKLEREVFRHKDQDIRITLSAGVSALHKKDKGWKALYDRADRFLYEAKNAGRNKVFAARDNKKID